MGQPEKRSGQLHGEMAWTEKQVYYRPSKRGVFDLKRFIADVLVGVDVRYLRIPTSLSPPLASLVLVVTTLASA